jgi:hypothetical protein
MIRASLCWSSMKMGCHCLRSCCEGCENSTVIRPVLRDAEEAAAFFAQADIIALLTDPARFHRRVCLAADPVRFRPAEFTAKRPMVPPSSRLFRWWPGRSAQRCHRSPERAERRKHAALRDRSRDAKPTSRPAWSRPGPSLATSTHTR